MQVVFQTEQWAGDTQWRATIDGFIGIGPSRKDALMALSITLENEWLDAKDVLSKTSQRFCRTATYNAWVSWTSYLENLLRMVKQLPDFCSDDSIGESVETLDEYQKAAETTAIYPNKGANIEYVVFGLASEVGELTGKIKKRIRDGVYEGGYTLQKVAVAGRDEFISELGDVLWYVSAIASELQTNLSNVASLNIQKLKSRKDRGQLHGSGDDR